MDIISLSFTHEMKINIESNSILKLGIQAALSKKAKDIVVLKLTDLVDYTDYFVLMSSSSVPQTKAIVETINQAVKKLRYKIHHVEGTSDSSWILVDCVDVVFHIFLPEAREFYALDRLWREAEHFDIENGI